MSNKQHAHSHGIQETDIFTYFHVKSLTRSPDFIENVRNAMDPNEEEKQQEGKELEQHFSPSCIDISYAITVPLKGKLRCWDISWGLSNDMDIVPR